MNDSTDRSSTWGGRRGVALRALALLVTLPALTRGGAHVADFQGKVELFLSKVDHWQPLKSAPYPLENGDVVAPKAGGWAKVAFDDGSYVEVHSSSRFVLEEARKDKVILNLILGKIRAWVSKAGGGREFSVRAPQAVCSVRGTEFTVEVDDGKRMRLEVSEGRVGVRTVMGESLEVGAGQILQVLPSGRIEARPQGERGMFRRAERAAKPAERRSGDAFSASSIEEFKKDMRREVGLGLSKDAVQAAAATEARNAEYQEGKTLIDVFGKRVRVEEYVVRPAADQFKLVVLNERSDRLDYFYYQAKFNQSLPTDLSGAMRYLNGKTGTAPEYFVTAYETGRSNTRDIIQENGTGGHLVNAALGADTVVYDPDSNSFSKVSAGTAFWKTLYDNYSYKVNSTEKFGWQPRDGVATNSYDYAATGFKTRILGGGADCALAGCATAGPITCTAAACETAARPSAITQPDGVTKLHDQVKISYAANGTSETYDFFVVTDEGKLATSGDFNGVTTGTGFKNTLLKFNYQQVITASEFGGRKIDLVVEPKILVKSGVIQ